MLATLAAWALFVPAIQSDLPKTYCPIMTNRPTTGRFAAEYAGYRIYLCCDQCLANIKNVGAKVVQKAQSKDQYIGDFMFDPATHLRIDKKQAKSTEPFNSFLFYSASSATPDFLTDKEKTALKAPTKECLTDPVTGKTFPWEAKSGAYEDVEGVRYFLTDADSLKALRANPQLVQKVAEKVTLVVAKPYPIRGIDD